VLNEKGLYLILLISDVGDSVRIANRKIIFYIFAIAAVLAYGVIGTYVLGQWNNFNVKINSWNEALYFTIVTISTVGYGDIVPITNTARDFVIVLIISGLSIFLSALTVLSGEFMGARLEHLYTGMSAIDRKRFSNHIVLVGFNTTNQLVARELMNQKSNFIIITRDKATAEELRKDGYPAYLVDYTQRTDLMRFNLDKARDIVVDLKDNSETVYVVLIIRKIASKAMLSVVAPTPEAEMHLSDLNVDTIISPVRMAANMLSHVLDRDDKKVTSKPYK
jgi:voltage-gated potassium channel